MNLSLFLFFELLLLYKSVSAFITFPINAETALDEFLKTIFGDNLSLEDDFMKLAVPGEECRRSCEKNNQKVCYFEFRLEHYQVLGGACFNCTRGDPSRCLHPQCVTADGVERGLVTVNRQLPGPPIEVCYNDLVVVDVQNHMDGASTAIHWHGMTQKKSPFADGVPFITQCPINSGNTFRYSFLAKNPGTNFYHSHAGLQRADGIYGALIVRTSEDFGFADLYDHDYFTVVISDWMHDYAEQFFPGLTSELPLFKSILVNGRAKYFDAETQKFTNVPLTTYHVVAGQRYRFRIINAASNVCSFIMKFDSHTFSVIASDGSSFKPSQVESLHISSGERYDIILEADQKPRDYVVQIKSLEPCPFKGHAILRYEESPVENPTTPEFFDLDNINLTLPEFNDNTFNSQNPKLPGILLSEVEGFDVKNDILNVKSDEEFYLFFGTPIVNNSVLFETPNTIKWMVTSIVENYNNIGVMNNISLSMPEFALMSEPEKIRDDIFCDEKTKFSKQCLDGVNANICRCTYRIKVKLNSIVDLLLIDVEDSLTHPFHLHGHKFYVLEMGSLNLTVEEIRNNGIPMGKFNKKPIHKDTVIVPNKGFIRIRFKADNPGFWLAHCHFEWHLMIGMGFILQVGEIEDMKKPPNDFEKCHSYIPYKN